MQHDNSIENKLRELEGMELPDLSQIDAHWQQMAASLQPVAVPVKRTWPKWLLNILSAVAVVVLVGAAMWFVSTGKNNVAKETIIPTLQNEDLITGNKDASLPVTTNAATIADSGITNTNTKATPIHIPSIDPSLITDIGNGDATQWTEQDSILSSIKLNIKDCLDCPGKIDGIVVMSNAERQLKLQSLFTELEKDEQHFTIDNSRDTLLQFEEGTGLFVPSNSFGGMKGIELSAKEFYKTSDIILNQLNTASNKEQLETGGMLQITTSYKGNEVSIRKEKSLTLFLPDTNNNIADMQLFFGEQSVNHNTISNKVNWVSKPQYFMKRRIVTEVRLVNLADVPWLIKESSKGKIGYFVYDEDGLTLSKKALKSILKEKYGYKKIKLTSSIRDRFLPTFGDWVEVKSKYRFSGCVGDSVWMEKVVADKYGLNTNNAAIRQRVVEELSSTYDSSTIRTRGKNRWVTENLLNDVAINSTMRFPLSDSMNATIVTGINSKYSVNLSQLGWINCDRFYTDSRKKVNYKVDLGDSAVNYYTMLVFDKINSMMTGVIDGTEVSFQNIPIGEPVKVISIGINKKGETVYSVTHTTTSEQELKGLQFQNTSAPDLRTALSKYDK